MNKQVWEVVTPDETAEVLASFKYEQWAKEWRDKYSATSRVLSVPAQQGVSLQMKTFEQFIKDRNAECIEEMSEDYCLDMPIYSPRQVIHLVEMWQKLNKDLAAQPLQPSLEEKKEDLVVSEINTDVSSVVSLTASVGNSIEQEAWNWWRELGEQKRLEIGSCNYGKTITQLYLLFKPL